MLWNLTQSKKSLLDARQKHKTIQLELRYFNHIIYIFRNLPYSNADLTCVKTAPTNRPAHNYQVKTSYELHLWLFSFYTLAATLILMMPDLWLKKKNRIDFDFKNLLFHLIYLISKLKMYCHFGKRWYLATNLLNGFLRIVFSGDPRWEVMGHSQECFSAAGIVCLQGIHSYDFRSKGQPEIKTLCSWTCKTGQKNYLTFLCWLQDANMKATNETRPRCHRMHLSFQVERQNKIFATVLGWVLWWITISFDSVCINHLLAHEDNTDIKYQIFHLK